MHQEPKFGWGKRSKLYQAVKKEGEIWREKRGKKRGKGSKGEGGGWDREDQGKGEASL